MDVSTKKLVLDVVPQTATSRPTATLIFLHGSGDTGNGFKQWIRMVLGCDFTFPHIKIIYPTAPLMPYTLNGGEITNVWFDRSEINIKTSEHAQTVDSACSLIKDLINEEIENGIPIDRIVIGGFSMGAGLALQVAYRFQLKLAGCVCLSSYLSHDSAVYKVLENEKGINLPPLLMCHGERDSLVKYGWSETTFEKLESFGVKGIFRTYRNMFHEIGKRELEVAKEWISERLL